MLKYPIMPESETQLRRSGNTGLGKLHGLQYNRPLLVPLIAIGGLAASTIACLTNNGGGGILTRQDAQATLNAQGTAASAKATAYAAMEIIVIPTYLAQHPDDDRG